MVCTKRVYSPFFAASRVKSYQYGNITRWSVATVSAHCKMRVDQNCCICVSSCHEPWISRDWLGKLVYIKPIFSDFQFQIWNFKFYVQSGELRMLPCLSPYVRNRLNHQSVPVTFAILLKLGLELDSWVFCRFWPNIWWLAPGFISYAVEPRGCINWSTEQFVFSLSNP